MGTERAVDHIPDWYEDDTTLLEELRGNYQSVARVTVVPGYDDLREIRRGGQGVVFVAQQRSTKRQVAVKVLHQNSLPRESRRRRFEREIEIVASLQHPNIVRVYDGGVTSDDRLYYVMEFVEGVGLDEYLQDQAATGLIPLRERLSLFAKICNAVGHAHLHGVIHRDIKPSNVRIDSSHEPRVLDFGVAKAVEVGRMGDGDRFMTLPGHFLGTLAYASPEQVSTDPDDVDIRTDVYSLGVILYELLSGSHPYPITNSMIDAVKIITESLPVPPSVRLRDRRPTTNSGKRLNQHVDDELDTIALTAMKKDPTRRYASAGALAKDIERYLAGEPIEAKRDSEWYLIRSCIRRYKLPLFVSCAAVLSLLGFSIAMTALYRSRDIEARKALQIKTFLEDTLGSVQPSRDGSGVTVREVLDQAEYFVESTLAGQPEVEASLRCTIGNSYRAVGAFDKAEKHLAKSLALAESIPGGNPLQTAQCLNSLGRLYCDRNESDRAEKLFRQSLTIRKKEMGTRNIEVVYTLQNLAEAVQRLGKVPDAERSFREALSLCIELRGPLHVDTAMVQFKLGEMLRSQGRLHEAEKLHRAALQTRCAVHQQHIDHPDIAQSLFALGRVQLEMGHVAGAESDLLQCVTILEASTGRTDLLLEARKLLLTCQGVREHDPESQP